MIHAKMVARLIEMAEEAWENGHFSEAESLLRAAGYILREWTPDREEAEEKTERTRSQSDER